MQLVRYESLEVTQEMIEGHVPNLIDTDQTLDIVCEKADKPLSFVLKIKEDNQQKQGYSNNNTNSTTDALQKKNKNTKKKRDVVISVEKIDNKGNLIKIEKIEKTTILHPSEIASENYKLIDKI